MNNSAKTLLALLGGAAVGAGLALLFAPASGEELRGKIKDRAADAKDGLSDLINRGKDAISGLKSRAKDEVENLAGEVSKQADKTISNNQQRMKTEVI